MRRAFLILTSALAVAPGLALAQQAPEPDVAGKAGANAVTEVVVSATRGARPIETVGASVTVLDRKVIEASQTLSVVELLAQTPGVSFVRNGGPGANTNLNIRGSENQHTVVLIDGVKLNDPSSTQGGFNSAHLLMGDISRIEVLRGAQSTLYGSQAIGGVVNIVTRDPEAPFEATADVEGGARTTGSVRAGVGGAGERLTWRVAGSRFATDGFSAYRFGREIDGYRNTGASGRLRYTVTDAVSAEARAVWSDGRIDIDAVGADSAEVGRTQELVAYAGLNVALLDGRLRNRIAFGFTDTDRMNVNPARTAQPLTFDAAGQNRRWEYQGAFAVRDGWTLTFGLERERARMRTRSPTVAAPNPAFVRGRAGIDSAYAQVQAEVTPGLTVTGGLRHDDHDTFGGRTLGQAAAAWALADGNTILRASWGEGFRAPGLFELFSEFGSRNLSPESFETWDAGVEQRLLDGRVRLSATWFRRDGENEIRFNGCTAASTEPLCRVNGVLRQGFYRNVLETDARGVELSALARPTERLTLSANYTWTRAETGAGLKLSRRPERIWNLQGGYRWPVTLETSVAVRHVGRTFNNDTNTQVVKGYTLVDLKASYPLGDGIEVFARVENALDEDYEAILNFGTAGRGGFAGVRVRF